MTEVIYIPRFGRPEDLVPVLVDEQDYDRFAHQLWHVHPDGYAQRRTIVAERRAGLPSVVKIHRLILDAPPGAVVDHINGDPADNRRCNLRICTRGQNNQNKGRLAKNNTSGERGVWFQRGRWLVRLRKHRQQHYYGSYLTFEEAVAVKRRAEAELYGEFSSARLRYAGVA